MTELHQAFEKKPELQVSGAGVIESSFDLVIDRAKEAGAVRADVDGSDVMQLVTPVCTNAASRPSRPTDFCRMILDGIRFEAVRGTSG